MNENHIFITPGDITYFAADVIVCTTDSFFSRGLMHEAFERAIPGFAEEYHKAYVKRQGVLEVGEPSWLPISGCGRLQGVVLVQGASAGPPFTLERIAVESAIACARSHLQPPADDNLRPLIAFPFIGTGLGGTPPALHLETARVQIAAARRKLDDEAIAGMLDVAFIGYTPDSLAVLARARRDVVGEPQPPLPVPDRLLDDLRAGEVVLFVGAGVSKGAGLYDWNDLIRRLGDELCIPEKQREKTSHLDIAQWYREEEGGNARLEEIIRSEFGRKSSRPTLAHYLLTSLPVRTFFTTNYDDLLGQSLEALKFWPVRITEEGDIPRTGSREDTFVVHLHGHVDRPHDVVLSRSDFDSYFKDRPAFAAILKSLLLNHTFFFVGYGLGDPNFWQIYNEISHILPQKRRRAYATAFARDGRIDELTARQLKNSNLEVLRLTASGKLNAADQFLRLLDFLCDRVVAGRQHDLFLRQQSDEQASLADALCAAFNAIPDAHIKAILLEFLTRYGWRPWHPQWLSRWWFELAHLLPPGDAPLRRRLLLASLRTAEEMNDVQRAREALAELDQPGPSPEPEAT
jgi:O-acetyl-ADP-ribose deacetylase (regulator of RNase III)